MTGARGTPRPGARGSTGAGTRPERPAQRRAQVSGRSSGSIASKVTRYRERSDAVTGRPSTRGLPARLSAGGAGRWLALGPSASARPGPVTNGLAQSAMSTSTPAPKPRSHRRTSSGGHGHPHSSRPPGSSRSSSRARAARGCGAPSGHHARTVTRVPRMMPHAPRSTPGVEAGGDLEGHRARRARGCAHGEDPDLAAQMTVAHQVEPAVTNVT
jgi:hypothetical protein